MNNELLIIDKPHSGFSEEIKRIRTNIKFSSVDEDVKTILVTSAVQAEGKSLITGNLAACFAQNGERVLLIDCDLRKGRQYKIVSNNRRTTKGFSKLLIDKDWKNNLEKYIGKTNVDNLDLIPSGIYPANPSELLASQKCRDIITKLSKMYDVVIMDCPPVEGLNDTLSIASIADMSILIADYKKTNRDNLVNAHKALTNVGAKKISVILNMVDDKLKKYYGYSYYYKSEEEE